MMPPIATVELSAATSVLPADGCRCFEDFDMHVRRCVFSVPEVERNLPNLESKMDRGGLGNIPYIVPIVRAVIILKTR